MSNQPVTPEPCDHHWVHYGQPSHSPIRWIVKCSQCNQFRIADLQEQVDVIVSTAEQRGAERALREAVKQDRMYNGISFFVPEEALLDRADQEGAQGE